MLRARAAAEAGREVTLIGLGAGGTSSEETIGTGHLKIIRLRAVKPEKSIIIRRSLWTLGIIFKLLRTTYAEARAHPDAEVKVTGAPPFFAYAFLLANVITLRRPITYRMTDFYPETAFAAGRAFWLRPFGFVFRRIRRLARHIEVLSEDQRRRLTDQGLPECKIELVRDWSPVDFENGTSAAPSPFGEHEITLLYSGNLGVAHEIETFCEAYRQHVHEGSNKVRLWLNAVGVGVDRMAEYCADHNLPLHISAPVGLDQLGAVLKAADAHLVLLGEPFWGYVFPSKTYAALKSGKPVFYIGPQESDVVALCTDNPIHIITHNGDVNAALAGFERLARL